MSLMLQFFRCPHALQRNLILFFFSKDTKFSGSNMHRKEGSGSTDQYVSWSKFAQEMPTNVGNLRLLDVCWSKSRSICRGSTAHPFACLCLCFAARRKKIFIVEVFCWKDRNAKAKIYFSNFFYFSCHKTTTTIFLIFFIFLVTKQQQQQQNKTKGTHRHCGDERNFPQRSTVCWVG